MLKQIKIGFIAMMAVAFLASCKNDQDSSAAVTTDPAVQTAPGMVATDPNVQPVSSDPNAVGQPVQPEANATNAAAAQPAVPTGPTTAIQFNETTHDFGKVKSPEKARHAFKFKNTGKEPLVISNAKGSCGCTVPKWTQEPIAPGASGEIMVEYDSKGKTGMQTKNVTVTANTDPPQTLLYIKADVIGEPAAATQTPNATKSKQ